MQIDGVQASTYHGLLVDFEYVKPYMSDRVLQQFGRLQNKLTRIVSLVEHHRPADNKIYRVKHKFEQAYQDDAQSHYVDDSR